MDDFESRLEHELSAFGRTPLAEPEPVERLRSRARRSRATHALTSVVAVTAAVALVVGAVVVVGNRDTGSPHLRVSAPNFLIGDVDAVVLSSLFDADGARGPIPPDLAARVAAVPGVRTVSGVLDTFAPVIEDHGDFVPAPTVPPRTPILFSYHKNDDVAVTDGRTATADNEIVVDADFLDRFDKQIGDEVVLQIRKEDREVKIVGRFELPGVDLTGIPMVAMSAANQDPGLQLDRIDVNLEAGAQPAKVRDAIARAVGPRYSVVPPSTITFADQRLAQVEIQHAYWALLSPNADERSTSGVGVSDSNEKQNYEKYSDLAKSVELRVENVTFLSPDAASLTYRIYYGGSPSPVITDPQTGAASRKDEHWLLATTTLCSLAALVGIKCDGEAAGTPITPPNGYETPNTLNPEVEHAFRVLTDPHATTDERVAAVENGEQLRDVVSEGVQHDQAVTKSALTIAGWRPVAANRIEVLYSLQTTGGPSTPWPTTGVALQQPDGHWYAAQRYACGIEGVASGGCYSDETGTPLTLPAA